MNAEMNTSEFYNSFSSAFENVERLKGINDKGISLEKNSFKVEQHLSASNLRYIERIYGKEGLVVMDKLHNDGPIACIAFHIQFVSRKNCRTLQEKILNVTRIGLESMLKTITSLR